MARCKTNRDIRDEVCIAKDGIIQPERGNGVKKENKKNDTWASLYDDSFFTTGCKAIPCAEIGMEYMLNKTTIVYCVESNAIIGRDGVSVQMRFKFVDSVKSEKAK